MKSFFKRKKTHSDSENFVWITFSDLLTTLFMVFMVISLWAIKNQDAQKKKGEECIENLNAVTQFENAKRESLNKLSKKMTAEFKTLQKSGICIDANIEEVEGTGGFRIFQKEGLMPWFVDGDSKLSNDAMLCLKGIGDIWVKQINSDKEVSFSLKQIVIEGHSNSKKFVGDNEENSFLKNLELSQNRALQASRFLIEKIKSPILKKNHKVRLRDLLTALGKSYLEPVKNELNEEDLERSKRLEFKVVLESKTNGV